MSSHLAANNIQPIIKYGHDMSFNMGIRDDRMEGYEIFKKLIDWKEWKVIIT